MLYIITCLYSNTDAHQTHKHSLHDDKLVQNTVHTQGINKQGHTTHHQSMKKETLIIKDRNNRDKKEPQIIISTDKKAPDEKFKFQAEIEVCEEN